MATQTLLDTLDNRDVILGTLQTQMPYLRQRYGVTRLALFGSAARGEAGPESDVDLLVELGRPLGLEFVGLALYLEDVLGRKVDLATFDTFHRTIRKPHRQAMAVSIQEDLVNVEAPA